MATHLDLLPELREKAQIRNLTAKRRAAKKYNTNLCPRSFAIGDLVWRMASSARKKDGKFSTNWTVHTAYVKTQGEEPIALNICLGKRYLTLGMYPTSNSISVKCMLQ